MDSEVLLTFIDGFDDHMFKFHRFKFEVVPNNLHEVMANNGLFDDEYEDLIDDRSWYLLPRYAGRVHSVFGSKYGDYSKAYEDFLKNVPADEEITSEIKAFIKRNKKCIERGMISDDLSEDHEELFEKINEYVSKDDLQVNKDWLATLSSLLL